MKPCTHCGASLPLSAFHRDRAQRDGLCRWCRRCDTVKKRNYRAKLAILASQPRSSS